MWPPRDVFVCAGMGFIFTLFFPCRGSGIDTRICAGTGCPIYLITEPRGGFWLDSTVLLLCGAFERLHTRTYYVLRNVTKFRSFLSLLLCREIFKLSASKW